jgi:hypothetical protein
MQRGVLVCHTSGALGGTGNTGSNPSMVEMTIGMMISTLREFGEQDVG